MSDLAWNSRSARDKTKAAAARFALVSSAFLAMLFLCACPKKEWHYTPPPAPAPSKDFDAHFDPGQLDPNHAPRNVDWLPQLQGRIPNPDACNDGQPYSSACTQNKPFQDQPDGVHEAFCFIGKAVSGSPVQPFYGHADWMVAQFDGSIGWFNFGDDWDYDLFLVPGALSQSDASNLHGVTTNNNFVNDNKNNPRYIEMEFDSDEVDTAFNEGFWHDFKMKGHDNLDDDVARLLHPNQKTLACGSVVGLFGLDCDHGCRSELHPVYGLAIQRIEDPSDNEWAVMVRNWGTGGYCSQYNDELAETNLSLILPYTSSQRPIKAEVQDFTSAANDSSAQVGCPSLFFSQEDGQPGQTILNLTLPPPEKQAVASFTLKIQWPAGSQPAACTQVNPAELTSKMLAAATGNPPSLNGEGSMGALLRAAARSERPILEKDILPSMPKIQERMQSLKHMALAPPPQPCRDVPIKDGRPQPQPLTAIHRLKKEPRKRVRDDAIRSFVCRAHRENRLAIPAGVNPQELDQACHGAK